MSEVDDIARRVLEPIAAIGELVAEGEEAVVAFVLRETDPDPGDLLGGLRGLPESEWGQPIGSMVHRLKKFSSVTQLVPPLFDHTRLLERLVEPLLKSYVAPLRGKSSAEIVAFLKPLEDRSFQYRYPATNAPIKDPLAFQRLRNFLAAVERLAYQDSAFLQRLQEGDEIHPELERLYLITAPWMTPELRGILFELEGEVRNKKDPPECLSPVDTIETPEIDQERHSHAECWVEELSRRYSQYRMMVGGTSDGPLLELRLCHNLLRCLDKTFAGNSGGRQGYPLHLEDQIRLAAMSDEELGAFGTASRMGIDDYAAVDVEWHYHFLVALFDTCRARGVEVPRLNEQEMEESFLDEGIEVPKGHQNNFLLARDLIFGRIPMGESRLDRYARGRRFLERVEKTLAQELGDERTDSHWLEHDSPFNAFLGQYAALAAVFGMPTNYGRIREVVERIRDRLGLSYPAKEVADGRAAAEAVALSQTMILTPMALPRAARWVDSEWEVMKRLTYRCIPLDRFVQAFVKTVRLTPTIEDDGRVRIEGLARGLFGNVELGYQGADGKPLPVWKRLAILCHEAFHNAEAARALDGFLPEGEHLAALRERNAYFFSASVLAGYLWLRIRHHGEFPLAVGEAKEVMREIATYRVLGKTANWFVSLLPPVSLRRDPDQWPPVYHTDPPNVPLDQWPMWFDAGVVQDDRIEIPIEEEARILDLWKHLGRSQPGSWTYFLLARDPTDWLAYRALAEVMHQGWVKVYFPEAAEDFVTRFQKPMKGKMAEDQVEKFLEEHPEVEALVETVVVHWGQREWEEMEDLQAALHQMGLDIR